MRVTTNVSGGGPRGAPRLMGMLAAHGVIDSIDVMPYKPKTYDEDIKDLEALLNKRLFREMQKSKTGGELLYLFHPTDCKEDCCSC